MKWQNMDGMSNPFLLKREKAVLKEIVCHPGAPNVALAKSMGTSISTFSTVRSRLKKRGILSITNFPHLGYAGDSGTELLAVIYGFLDPCCTKRDVEDAVKRVGEIYDCVLLHQMAEEKFMVIAAGKNYTQIQSLMIAWKRAFLDLMDPSHHMAFRYAIIPLATAEVHSFFDFDRLLSLSFGMPFGKDAVDHTLLLKPKPPNQTLSLSATEIKVLLSLLEDAEQTDVAIAERINRMRHTVSRARHRFMEAGLYQPICMVNLNKLAYDVQTLIHITFGEKTTTRSRKHVLREFLSYLPIYFFIEDDSEAVILLAFKDFTEYSLHRKNIMCHLSRNAIVKSLPVMITYSIPRMEVYRPLSAKKYFERCLSEIK